MSLFDQLYDVAHCAINDVTPEMVADGTAAAVITDPPYPRKCLPLFSSLSRFAERVLKPGGWCVAMSGNAFLPDVLNRLGEHLKDRWAFAVVCPGGRTNRNWGLCLFQAYKPVLIYQKPPVALDHDFTPDVIVSLPREYNKSRHPWQQSESVFARLVERFTQPGDLVVDPFAGSGTTGRAATSRRAVAL
jgi:hypothetical protein